MEKRLKETEDEVEERRNGMEVRFVKRKKERRRERGLEKGKKGRVSGLQGERKGQTEQRACGEGRMGR